MAFNFSNLVNDHNFSSQPNLNPSSNISVDLKLTPIRVEDHIPSSRPAKRSFTRSVCKPLEIGPSGSSMASSSSQWSSFNDSELESPSFGTPSRFFDGLQSSVTEDEFSELISSLQLPNSVTLRLSGKSIALLALLPENLPSTSAHLSLGLLFLSRNSFDASWVRLTSRLSKLTPTFISL